MLELIKTSGCQVAPGVLEQLLFYNRSDVFYKTMNQFEPSKAFADPKTATALQRVGEHPSFDSDEDFEATGSETETSKPTTCKKVL